MVAIREVNDSDRQALEATLLLAYSKTNKPVVRDTWSGFIPAVVDEIVLQRECTSVVVNETYVLCYYAGETWWTHLPIFVEYSVMRIYPEGPGKFSDVTEAMEILARKHGCKHIQVGTMFAPKDGPLVRKYERQGFEQQCVTLVKTLED